MAEPHWTSYVGIVSGLIGAITGISGALMGYKSYRRSNKLKSMELRLELRKDMNTAYININKMKEQMDKADRSRKRLLFKLGHGRSGAMDKWKNEVSADKNKVVTLLDGVPKSGVDYDKMHIKELERALVKIHGLNGQIQHLLDKYSEAIRSDGEQWKQIHEDRRARNGPLS